MTETPAADTARQLLIQRIYLKDCSLEVPKTPQIFARPWNPQLDVQLNTAVNAVEPDIYEVQLVVTVTAKLGEDVAFLVEVKQAGVFALRGFAAPETQAVLATFGPTSLFPYAREAISGMVMRAGFPPLVLQPVNFDALYAEHVMREKARGTGNGAGVVVQ
jgi:preprotein translocase subunit SecB